MTLWKTLTTAIDPYSMSIKDMARITSWRIVWLLVISATFAGMIVAYVVVDNLLGGR